MREEKVIGTLFLFRLKADYSIERRVLNIISETQTSYVTRDMDTNYKKTYSKYTLNKCYSNRVIMLCNDWSEAKEIISKSLFKRMLHAQDEANKATNNFSKFKEANP